MSPALRRRWHGSVHAWLRPGYAGPRVDSCRIAGALLLAATLAAIPGAGAHAAAAPPNLVAISDRLVTSGQPSADWLGTLRAQGFDAVIHLAPPTVPDAVQDEARIVASQGIAFVNIPIRFEDPRDSDLALFSGVMQALAGRKVLVHCQVNFRASSLVFLDRVTRGREDPERAYEAVTKVWKPEGAWRRFIDAQLRRHGIAFEVY